MDENNRHVCMLKPSEAFKGPPESGGAEFVSVELLHAIEGLTTVHKMDSFGLWCSDGDYEDAAQQDDDEFIYRLNLIPWANVVAVGFTAAT